MGKRKSSSKPQGPKKRELLSTTFQCLFCNHENSVTVKLDKKSNTGDLSCKVCGQTYQTGINYLSAPIDVYSDWIDACDAVAKEAADGAGRSARVPNSRILEQGVRKKVGAGQGMSGRRDEVEEGYGDGDGFVEDDEVDGEAEYGGD